MKNRLNLDFSITTFNDRVNFINQPGVIPPNPTHRELEQIADYCLWGKNEDGKNAHQRHEIELSSPIKAWDRASNRAQIETSLEEVLSTSSKEGDPISLEDILVDGDAPPQIKPKSDVFDRYLERHRAPAQALAQLEELWHQIDTLDLQIAYAEGKEPRQELVDRFTGSELDSAFLMSQKWNSRTILRRKHQLVQLRQQQYSIRDSYLGTPIKSLHTAPSFQDLDIQFQLRPAVKFSQEKQFWDDHAAEAEAEDTATQAFLKNFYASTKAAASAKFLIDLRDSATVIKVFDSLLEIQDFIAEAQNSKTEDLQNLVDALSFYRTAAKLSPAAEFVLDQKIRKTPNKEIVELVDKNFGHRYTVNYISTLYTKKISQKIADAAKLHEKMIESIGIKEEWKKCSSCGRTLLLNENFFTHSRNNKSGFGPRCKECQKKIRLSKAQKEN